MPTRPLVRPSTPRRVSLVPLSAGFKEVLPCVVVAEHTVMGESILSRIH
jgi:hypothetical protein